MQLFRDLAIRNTYSSIGLQRFQPPDLPLEGRLYLSVPRTTAFDSPSTPLKILYGV